MIDYEVLCQTIEDWRAGRRPSLDLATPAAEEYAEVDSYEFAEPHAEVAQDYVEEQAYAEPAPGQDPAQHGDAMETYEAGEYVDLSQDQEQIQSDVAAQSYETRDYPDPGLVQDDDATQAYEPGEYAEPPQGVEPAPAVPEPGHGGVEGEEEFGGSDAVEAGEEIGSPQQEVVSGGTSPMEVEVDVEDDDPPPS